MADHAWVQENLDTYLAGDLTTRERENVDCHVASCEACKQAFAEARQLAQMMHGLFADARPATNLDERIIQGLGKAPMRSQKGPSAWRFVGAAAAVVVVGVIGAVVQAVSSKGSYRDYVQLKREVEESAAKASASHQVDVLASQLEERTKKEGFTAVDMDPSLSKVDTDINYMVDRLPDVSVPGSVRPNEAIGIQEGAKEIPPVNLSAPAGFGVGGQGGMVMGGGGGAGGFGGMPSTQTPMTRKPPSGLPAGGTFYGRTGVTASTAAGGRASGAEGLFKHKAEVTAGPSKAPKAELRETGKEALGTNNLFGLGIQQQLENKDNEMKARLFRPNSALSLALPTSGSPAPMATQPSQTANLPSLAYFAQPSKRLSANLDNITKDLGQKTKETPRDDLQPAGKETGRKENAVPTGAQKPTPHAEPKQPPPAEPPMETNRKIIRTGEMEFETDSFDKAVENITRLITAVKGGFVATVNSDKLANGKMRGSVVVRMPPQYLDKFVLDLRREMAKSGELKNQRIISLDVTKQYTDIESRLRAARTMEDRLIQIIKIGKGEIKDLVAAERELGIWRTKIEEMEGEIRYYGNQVALSTLTITINEKEILAPTAIVVTENVRMRLEVEDVAKAHQIAMSAVEEMKGRITKSELKQHSAGQLQSILCADIPPAKKEAFRDRLTKLGILSDHEENQSQHTEGGVGKGAELKPRQSDVHFDVTMHNTANVRPRLTADLKIATSDVPGAYAKIVEAVAKAKGQVRDGKLNEQDKLNITAHLDFNVPTAEKKVLDKVLAEIGPVLERVNVQAPVNELSTDRKFGYTLLLRDFASIPPRKSVVEIIATTDVPASYAKLQETIAKVKGQVADGKLNEQDKLNINAQLDFTVLAEDKPVIDALLKELGTSLSRTNNEAPMKQLTTAKKFGYTLTLRDFASIPPSKATDLKIAVNDVPASYAKISEAITKAKGQVADAKLNEQDKLHITAQLAFTVPTEEKTSIDKLLVEIGTLLSRNNIQAPASQLSTAKKFGYALDLRDFATIPPSQASALTIAASNVPGNYAKVMEAIAKAKGQVRDGKLNEQDKLNVTGQIDFTVPSTETPAIEKLLGEIGTILSRNNVQAPVNELSTDGKFGYSVVLRDFANIPPRETFILQIALNDVPATFREFQETVAQAKGWVSVGKLVEDNKAKIEAQFDFDVPANERQTIEKLLAKTGAIISRTSSQVAVNDLATDQKTGYRLTLRSTASIPPREKVLLKLEVSDVDSKVTELKELILAGKGRVVDSSIDRQENGQTAAIMVFEVPFASEETLIRQMKGTGKLVSQKTMRNPQIPENELTTAHLIVTLAGGNPIVPSDEGLWSYVRTSLSLSFKILAIIVMSIVVGLSAVVPCVVLIWLGFKLYALTIGGGQGRLALATTGPAGVPEDDKPAEGDPTANR